MTPTGVESLVGRYPFMMPPSPVQRAKAVTFLLVSASFGPRLLSVGIRTDHVALYLLFPIALGFLLLGRRSTVSSRAFVHMLLTLAAAILWTLFSTLMNLGGYASFAKLVSYTERYLEPLAIVAVAGAMVRPSTRSEGREMLAWVAKVYIAFLCLNTALIAVGLLVDISSLMSMFMGGIDPSNPNTWQQSAQGGRYLGMFSQPIISGLSYSLGCFLWLYATRTAKRIATYDYAALVLLLVGGAASISKAFLLGGLPVLLLYALLQHRLRIFFNGRFLLMIGAAAAVGIAYLEKWIGLPMLMGLIKRIGGEEGLFIATGTRFGSSESYVLGLFREVWRRSPLYGLGFGSVAILDSAYAEFFVQGGAVALALYGILLLQLGMCGMRWLKSSRDEGLLMVMLTVYVIGSGLGGPVITAGRFAVPYWLVIALLVQTVATHAMGTDQTGHDAAAEIARDVARPR